MKDKKPRRPSELPPVVHQLSDAEATLRAIVSGQVDSIVDPLTGATRVLQEAQTALLESEQRYHRLVNRIAVVILELEPSGTIRFANEALLHVLGFDPAEVVGRAFTETFADPRDPAATEAFWNTVHREDVTKYELRIASKTGAMRMLEITSANQFGADGVP
ncbi:MAG: PAS domain-containing protein, partial [Candidatus Hydrogenedentes bacterium]|nr:PAS domain-containing protein [Candidatus Hydrogenedentota bacterium]